MLTLVIILKALVEIAALALLGQGLLVILAGAKRHTNPFYQLLSVVTRPVTALVRLITPRLIVDQHIGLLSFLLLVMVWVALTVLKVQLAVSLASGQG